MSKWLRRLRRWWRPLSATVDQPVPFQVACLCGHVARGLRLRQHQVLPCTHCGRNVFVLPVSPLPPLAGAPSRSAPAEPLAPTRIVRWRSSRLWFGGAIGVLLLVAGWLLWLSFFGNNPTRSLPAIQITDGPETVAARLRAAEAHLDQGEVQLALTELTAADKLAGQRPEWCSPTQRVRLQRLQEQTLLLRDLLGEPLEDLLRHAAALAPAEWQQQFALRYRGKAFALDVTASLLAEGRIEHDYRLFVQGEPARLNLDDLKLLHALPLDPPQRIFVLGRLADIRRQPGQPWTVYLQPDSGVLLTEAGVANVCGLDPHAAEIRQGLERQARWLAGK